MSKHIQLAPEFPPLGREVNGVAKNQNGNHVFLHSTNHAMRCIERLVAEIALTDIPVLLLGESGTGKDVLASLLHRLSEQKEQPLIKLNCATLEAESLRKLLGSVNGVTSGEGELKAGTLLLDEVCDLDAKCQALFLATLPDGGENAGARRALRLICTSSHNLEEQLRAGHFREELYFRINGVCLRVPPLRHRREDIPLLLKFFVEKLAADLGRPIPVVSQWTLQAALDHNWPGNIRELENFARKLVVFENEDVAITEINTALHAPREDKENGGVSLKDVARAASRHAERELILKTLTRTRWNRKRAAKELQISYKALLYKLKQIGVEEATGT